MEIGNWIGLMGVIAGLIAFLTGLVQYVKGQKWKRAEFVAKEIKEFESDPKNDIAMQMLDWNSREYELFPDEKDPDNRKIDVEDSTLCSALVPHTKKPSGFKPVEVCIRDIFDQFLDAFERFEHFIQSGLVNPDEFKPYLIYWIEIMGDNKSKRKPPEFYKSLWSYIDFYSFTGVQKLFSRYGFDIHLSKV